MDANYGIYIIYSIARYATETAMYKQLYRARYHVFFFFLNFIYEENFAGTLKTYKHHVFSWMRCSTIEDTP